MKTRTPLLRIDRLLIAALALLAAPQVQAQFNLTTTNYTQNFNALGTNNFTNANRDLGALSNALTGWYWYETGSNSNNILAVNNGSSGTGDTFNFGATGGSDRSLGSVQSGSLISSWGFWFSNSLGATITNLQITYLGETWRIGATNRTDVIDFSYSGANTNLAASTWTNFDGLDYTNTASATTVTTAQTAPIQTATISDNLSVSILAGGTFFIRWSDFNASGTDDGLSIDDFSLTAFIQEIIGALNWAGGSGNWDTGFSGAVTNGAALSFSGPGGIATNNLTSPLIAAMTFSNGAGSYSVAGNAFTISNGIVNNSANTQVFSNAITLGAAQTFDAASGAMTFDGTIDNATFRLTVSGSSHSTMSGIISGSGGLTKSGTGTAFLSGANTYSGGTLISAGGLQGDTTSLQGTITNNASIVFNQATNGAYGSVLSGTGTLIKIGASTLTLSGGNSFSGALTISNGAVRLSNATGAGATAGGIAVVNGAALELTGGIAVGAEALSLNGAGISSGGALRSISGNNSYAGAITLATGSSIATDADTFTISGGITGTGHALTIGGAGNTTISTTGINTSTGGTLTKNGAGTLTISASGNYTGATTISTGVVRVTTASALGATNTGTTVADGAALELSGGFSLNAEAMNISGAGVGNGGVIRNVSGDNTVTGFITLAANSRINSDGGLMSFNPTGTDVNVITGNFDLSLGGAGNLSFSDRIAIGTGALTKDGAGTLTLTSGASHSGGTTLSAGTIRLGAGDNNALGTGTVALNGGILSGNNTVERTLTNSVTIGGNVGFGDGAATGAIVLSGPVNLGSATRTLDVSNTTTLSGIVGGATGVGLTKVGAGTIILSGANTFDGAIQVNTGALRAANSAGLGTTGGGVTVANGAALELAGGIAVGAESLSLTGTGIDSTGALRSRSGVNSFAGAISLGGSTDIASDAGTLTLSGGITGTGQALTIEGSGDVVITNTGINTGLLGTLAKTGTGALVIAAASDYTGTTTIGTGGEIIAAHANALGTTDAGTTVSSGGALWLTNNTTVGAESLSLAGTGVSSSGALRSLAGNNAFGGAITLTDAARINSDGGTLTLDVAAGDGITGAFALTFGGAGNIVVSDAIATSTGSLTKDGAGTLTLSGVNTYIGGTLISAGSVVGNASSLQGNITNNAGLTFDQSGTGTYNGNLSGSGVLVKDNAGTLILTGNNAQNTGGTLISGGTLQIGNGGTTGSLSGNITNNASLAFNRSDNLSYTGAVSGNGSLLKTGAGTLTLSGTNTYLGGTLLSAGALAGTTASLQGNITNNAAVVFDQSTSGAYTGTMTGTGSLTKAGAGTVTLSGANNYGGGTTVEAGALAGTTGSLQGNIANNGTVIFDQSTTGAYSGTLSGSGALVKAGSGVVTVEGDNTFAGGTTVNGGTLVAANNNALGSGLVTVTNGSTFAAAGVTLENDFTIGSAGGVGPGTNVFVAGWDFQSTNNGGTAAAASPNSPNLFRANFGVQGSNAIIYLNGSNGSSSWVSSQLTAFGGSSLNTKDGMSTVTTGDSSLAVVNPTGTSANGQSIVLALDMTGLASLDLSYASRFSGSTAFNRHTWEYSTDGSAWTGFYTNTGLSTAFAVFSNASSITALSNSATAYLRLTVSGATATGGNNRLDNIQLNALSLPTTIAASGSGILGINQAGSAIFSGNILNHNQATLTAVSGGTATFSGAISGLGSVTKTGEGTVTLSGANTYSGGTTISTGVLSVGDGGTSGSVTGPITNNAALVFNRSDTSAYSGAISGSGAVTKSGAGSLTLSGASSYSGETTVSAGTLELNNTTGQALASTTSLSVTNGAILLISQSNQVNNSASVSLSGGTITRGAGVSEVFGALTLGLTGGTLDFGTGAIGTFSFTSYTPSALLTVNNFLPGNKLTFTSNLSSDIENSALFSFGGEFQWDWDTTTPNTFTITAIPEPSTYLAAAGLLSLMLWPSRKRLLKDAKKILGLTPPMRDRLAARREQKMKCEP